MANKLPYTRPKRGS